MSIAALYLPFVNQQLFIYEGQQGAGYLPFF